MSEAAWLAVETELAHWTGEKPRLFLRDDDAVSDTPALQRLFELAARHDAPLLLAAIPAHSDASLGRAVRAAPLVTGAVHGWAHVSHAPQGRKPCELGGDRPVETVLGELRAGREKLGELFGGRLSGLVVPPWNRIEAPVLARIGEAGFKGVSAHGWLDAPSPVPSVNAHLDVVHWSAGGVGRDLEWVFSELARNLSEARLRGNRAVGLLTHHLAHDEAAWTAIGSVMERIDGRARWVAADELIGETPERQA